MWWIIGILCVLALLITIGIVTEDTSGDYDDFSEQWALEYECDWRSNHIKRIKQIFYTAPAEDEISGELNSIDELNSHLDHTKFNIVALHNNKLKGYVINDSLKELKSIFQLFDYVKGNYKQKYKDYYIMEDQRFLLNLVNKSDNTDTISLKLIFPIK